MKENKGIFKQKSDPTIIGDKHKDEPDIAELIDNVKARQEGGSEKSDEEDNEEGMGDINLDEKIEAEDEESDD